jgi:hypothetical protein
MLSNHFHTNLSLGLIVENGKLATSLGTSPDANINFFAVSNVELVCAASTVVEGEIREDDKIMLARGSVL